MEKIELTEEQFNIITDFLKEDAVDLAKDPVSIEQSSYNPKQYIDERILLCQTFDIDFWNTIDFNCSHYVSEKLKALYVGIPIAAFVAKYERLSDNELAKGFLKALIKNNKDNNQ